MKNLDPAKTRIYLERGDQLVNTSKLVRGEFCYLWAEALVAVHSAISYGDAIQVALTGKKPNFESHSQATQALKTLCAKNNVHDIKGIDHFSWLLGKKNEIAYGDKRFANVDLASLRAERFAAWVYETFREVLRAEEDTE